MMRPRVLAILLSLVCTGCGIGIGDGGGSAGDGLAHDVTGTSAPWLVLDLAAGTVEGRAAAPSLADPELFDRYMVFRRIAAGDADLGGGSLARQDDEHAFRAAHGAYYLALCEVTRAQWRRLAGTEPWQDQPVVAGAVDRLPALGISLDAAQAMLRSVDVAEGARLRLPDAVEWEVAARAGSVTSFPWGEGDTAGIAGRYAVTADTAVGEPAAVASRDANAFGFHDMCGNAWELTSDGAIRGGSWADTLILSRPANQAAIEADTRHATVGLRLVYVP